MMVVSFAVERTAKENYSAAQLQKTYNIKIAFNSGSNHHSPPGLEGFCFSASQRKAKK
jgi:hypothetical protein